MNPPPAGATTAAAARHAAAKILSGPPYVQHDDLPRPLAGFLHAVGHGVLFVADPVWHWLLHLFHPIRTTFTGIFGNWWPLPAIALVLVAGVLGALAVIRRRIRRGDAWPLWARAQTRRGEDPGELEQSAAAAEAAGDYAEAVRLRFRAGLARLELAGMISEREVHTSRELAGTLHSPTFDALAARHEAIVYGRLPATSDDAGEARQRWPTVPDEARRSTAGAGSR